VAWGRVFERKQGSNIVETPKWDMALLVPFFFVLVFFSFHCERKDAQDSS
jgi:Flp pilus assembly protein TadG